VSFPVYAAYQDSGVDWLGEVPEHWTSRRLGFYFRERREKVSDEDFEPLSVTMRGIVPRIETAAKSDDRDNRKKVSVGDFVINSRSDRKGSAGISPLSGSVSLISTVLEPQEAVVGAFVHHLLRSVDFQEEYYRFGKGIVADLWSTNYSDMRDIRLAMPPVPEQIAIAAFLDRETAKIDALVAEQRRLIDLLKEKRQALISHAVTKGLNPHARMKSSGIEWLGDVPEHWSVMRLKYLKRSIEQGWSPQCEGCPAERENEWGVLKVGCVNGGAFNPTENKLLPADLEPIPALAILSGDLLISRANTRELVGSAAVALKDYPKLLLCDKLYRLRLQTDFCSPVFLSFYLGSKSAREPIELGATGASASMVNIGHSEILELEVAVPPIEEQHEIAIAISEDIDKSNTLIVEASRAIDLLQERRTALISAAVTGQIDVRGLLEPEAA
jgi:type I restriction enzyme, S subunit